MDIQKKCQKWIQLDFSTQGKAEQIQCRDGGRLKIAFQSHAIG